MIRRLFLFFLLFPAVLSAQEPDSSSALFRMLEAERSFAKASAMNGTRDAFAEFLAEFSMIFTDEWISNGKEYWTSRSPAPRILKWEPEYMEIADSRDFGISTGPWEAQEYRPNTKPVGTGYFLSVWSVQEDGTWKAVLDAGISCPPPLKGSEHPFSFPPGDDKPVPNPASFEYTATILIDEEAKLLEAWRKDPSYTTISSFIDKDIRSMRNGHLPSQNPDTLKKWIAETGKSLTWEARGSGVAGSADLAYTYGIAQTSGKKGNFVRIWRKNAEGEWKISVDLINLN